MKIEMNIKPLTVNQCWQGRRFKTKEYDSYEREVLLRLPPGKLPLPPYSITFEFGMSNVMSDYDNPIKPIQDILAKKYGFNDAHIYRAEIRKVKVKKGEEYFTFQISTYLAA